jgi:exodeoxyribonuclease VII small subunit
MTDKDTNKELEKKIEKMPFEDLMKRLEEVTDELSKSNISLDKMIELYQEGEILKTNCKMKLDEAKMKISVVNQ